MVWTERATRGRDPIIAGEAGAKCCGRYVGAMRFRWCFVEPMTGIEPAYSAWEGGWVSPTAFASVHKIAVLLALSSSGVRSDPLLFGTTCNIDATI